MAHLLYCEYHLQCKWQEIAAWTSGQCNVITLHRKLGHRVKKIRTNQRHVLTGIFQGKLFCQLEYSPSPVSMHQR